MNLTSVGAILWALLTPTFVDRTVEQLLIVGARQEGVV